MFFFQLGGVCKRFRGLLSRRNGDAGGVVGRICKRHPTSADLRDLGAIVGIQSRSIAPVLNELVRPLAAGKTVLLE